MNAAGTHAVKAEFKKAVNMSATTLAAWLKTAESRKVGFIYRHLAQRPAGNIAAAPWRYSLMNWGHDPQVK